MKKLFIGLFLLAALCLHAQTYVKIPFSQPQIFTVSADSVFKSIEPGALLNLGTEIEINGGSGSYSFVWLSEGTVLGNSLLLNVSSVGEYILNIKDDAGCETRVVYQVKLNTDIGKLAINQLNVYPLPADQFVFIRPLNNLILKSVTVHTAAGELVKSVLCNRDASEIIQLGLDGMESGQYFLTCNFENKKITRVIVKK